MTDGKSSANNKIVWDTPNPPCGTVKVILHSKLGATHSRYIKRATLEKHGFVLDNERGLLIKREAKVNEN